MIKIETVIINGTEYEHIGSDEHKQVCRNGQSWDEVYNPLNTRRVYTEGDPIADEEEETSAAQIVDILLGENND